MHDSLPRSFVTCNADGQFLRTLLKRKTSAVRVQTHAHTNARRAEHWRSTSVRRLRPRSRAYTITCRTRRNVSLQHKRLARQTDRHDAHDVGDPCLVRLARAAAAGGARRALPAPDGVTTNGTGAPDTATWRASGHRGCSTQCDRARASDAATPPRCRARPRPRTPPPQRQPQSSRRANAEAGRARRSGPSACAAARMRPFRAGGGAGPSTANAIDAAAPWEPGQLPPAADALGEVLPRTALDPRPSSASRA